MRDSARELAEFITPQDISNTGSAAPWSAIFETASKHLSRDGIAMVRGATDLPLELISKTAQLFFGLPIPYAFFVTPRRNSEAGFVTATDSPPARSIRFHNECGYLPSMPRYLLFICKKNEASGGRTRFARSADVTKALPTSLLSLFKDDVEYRWCFAGENEIRRQIACDEVSDAPRMLASLGVEANIDARGWLHARSNRPGLTRMPDGSVRWLNHVWALHHSTIPAALLELYARQYGVDLKPHDVIFSDGRPISAEDVALIGEAYEVCAYEHTWMQNDLIIVDNFQWAHGREPYVGVRDIVVRMY